jgi:nitrate reductase (NAD(P)H)
MKISILQGYKHNFINRINMDYTLDVVRQHNSDKSCWLIINDGVYDVTNYLDDHPGGSEIIVCQGGKDATKVFNEIGHSSSAVRLLNDYKIGQCSEREIVVDEERQSLWNRIVTWWYPTVYLTDASVRKQVTLVNKESITHDTVRLTYRIPREMTLGIGCGQHICVYDGSIQRKYTPTVCRPGEFELVVKLYPDGKMSNLLNTSSTIDISGPFGKHIYLGNGKFNMDGIIREPTKILCICAGTGITPIYAIVSKLRNDSNISVRVLYVNKTEQDILFRDEMSDVTTHTLTRPGAEWTGSVGRPTDDMLRLYPLDSTVLVCGSHEFNKSIKTLCQLVGFQTVVLF